MHSTFDVFNANANEYMYATMGNLEQCLAQINSWMNLNNLKMNTSKMESMLLSSKAQIVNAIFVP